MSDEVLGEFDIAVLIPCYNEQATIGEVVLGFRQALPLARIFVYDNNSGDETAMRAALAGATVVRERRQGKGHVVRRMFADVDADIYVMVDGDGTYAAKDAPDLVRTLVTERADMVVGRRRGIGDDAGRRGHAFGNRIFNALYGQIFGSDFTDIFSGYRAFTHRYAKSFPALSPGFEIETEMSVHASMLRMPVSEITLDYGRRVEGSPSKLSTFRDGARILWMFATLMKETRPFAFFSYVALVIMAVAIGFMAPVFAEYIATGYVDRLPTWVLAMALTMSSLLVFAAGIILDSLSRARAEQKRMHYLTIPALKGARRTGGTVALRAALEDDAHNEVADTEAA